MAYPSEAVNAAVLGNSNPTAVQRSNAGFMAPNQTAKTYTGQVTLSASPTSVSLETVTTGKSFYITDIVIVTDYSNATGTLDVQIQAAGAAIFRSGAHNLTPIDAVGLETQPVATTGQAVTLNLAAATTSIHVWYFISGWEQ